MCGDYFVITSTLTSPDCRIPAPLSEYAKLHVAEGGAGGNDQCLLLCEIFNFFLSFQFRSLKLPPAPVDGAEHRHLRQLPAAPEGGFKCFTRRRLKLRLTQGNAALRTLVLTIEAVSQKASSTNTLASMVKSTYQGLVNQSSTTATIHVAVSCCHFSADAI